MAKAQPVSKFEKFLMYAVGVLVSSLMAIQVAQNARAEKIMNANHDHTIASDIVLRGLSEDVGELKLEVRYVTKQVSTVCQTLIFYWPEHAKDC